MRAATKAGWGLANQVLLKMTHHTLYLYLEPALAPIVKTDAIGSALPTKRLGRVGSSNSIDLSIGAHAGCMLPVCRLNCRLDCPCSRNCHCAPLLCKAPPPGQALLQCIRTSQNAASPEKVRQHSNLESFVSQHIQGSQDDAGRQHCREHSSLMPARARGADRLTTAGGLPQQGH